MDYILAQRNWQSEIDSADRHLESLELRHKDDLELIKDSARQMQDISPELRQELVNNIETEAAVLYHKSRQPSLIIPIVI